MQFVIRKLGALLLLALLLAVATTAPLRADDDDEFIAGEVLVKLYQSSDLAAIANDYGLDPTPLDQFGARAIYRLRILDGGASPEEVAAELAADSRVKYAEPNFVAESPESRQRSGWAIGGDSKTFVEQWAPKKIRLPRAQELTKGKGVVVAVLDTGVERTHPKLAKQLLAGYDFVDNDNDPSEVGVQGTHLAFGHGTHVAGLVRLIAPKAKIMPVRVLDPNGQGNVWVLAEAFAYALNPDGNVQTDDGADVINMSLSTLRETKLLADVLDDLGCDDDDDNGVCDDDDGGDDDDKGIGGAPNASASAYQALAHHVVIVAAAGNRASSTMEYPAAEISPELIAVAASAKSDTLAAFSNYGAWVHVAAPGEHITSTVPGGKYGVWSGTSMAAPIVAGEAALIRARFPALSAAEVVTKIKSATNTISGAVPKRINVWKAVK